MPMRQFCYLQAGKVSVLTEITVRLATKDGSDAVTAAPFGVKDARAVGLPLQQICDAGCCSAQRSRG